MAAAASGPPSAVDEAARLGDHISTGDPDLANKFLTVLQKLEAHEQNTRELRELGHRVDPDAFRPGRDQAPLRQELRACARLLKRGDTDQVKAMFTKLSTDIDTKDKEYTTVLQRLREGRVDADRIREQAKKATRNLRPVQRKYDSGVQSRFNSRNYRERLFANAHNVKNRTIQQLRPAVAATARARAGAAAPAESASRGEGDDAVEMHAQGDDAVETHAQGDDAESLAKNISGVDVSALHRLMQYSAASPAQTPQPPYDAQVTQFVQFVRFSAVHTRRADVLVQAVVLSRVYRLGKELQPSGRPDPQWLQDALLQVSSTLLSREAFRLCHVAVLGKTVSTLFRATANTPRSRQDVASDQFLNPVSQFNQFAVPAYLLTRYPSLVDLHSLPLVAEHPFVPADRPFLRPALLQAPRAARPSRGTPHRSLVVRTAEALCRNNRGYSDLCNNVRQSVLTGKEAGETPVEAKFACDLVLALYGDESGEQRVDEFIAASLRRVDSKTIRNLRKKVVETSINREENQDTLEVPTDFRWEGRVDVGEVPCPGTPYTSAVSGGFPLFFNWRRAPSSRIFQKFVNGMLQKMKDHFGRDLEIERYLPPSYDRMTPRAQARAAEWFLVALVLNKNFTDSDQFINTLFEIWLGRDETWNRRMKYFFVDEQTKDRFVVPDYPGSGKLFLGKYAFARWCNLASDVEGLQSLRPGDDDAYRRHYEAIVPVEFRKDIEDLKENQEFMDAAIKVTEEKTRKLDTVSPDIFKRRGPENPQAQATTYGDLMEYRSLQKVDETEKKLEDFVLVVNEDQADAQITRYKDKLDAVAEYILDADSNQPPLNVLSFKTLRGNLLSFILKKWPRLQATFEWAGDFNLTLPPAKDVIDDKHLIRVQHPRDGSLISVNDQFLSAYTARLEYLLNETSPGKAPAPRSQWVRQEPLQQDEDFFDQNGALDTCSNSSVSSVEDDPPKGSFAVDAVQGVVGSSSSSSVGDQEERSSVSPDGSCSLSVEDQEESSSDSDGLFLGQAEA